MLKDWAMAAGFAAMLAVALSGSLFWALNYPSPSVTPAIHQENAHADEAEQDATRERYGTQSRPFIVKVLPPAPGSPEAAKDEQEHRDKSSIDRGLLYFTGVLAVATIGLMIATIGLVGFAKQQSKETRILQRAYMGALPGEIETTPNGQIIGPRHL